MYGRPLLMSIKNTIKFNLVEMIERLEKQDEEDIFCIDESIDILGHINDSYRAEIPTLKEALAKTSNDEVMNFIICVLMEITNSIDAEIIEIFYLKLTFIIKQQKSMCFDVPDYILQYISRQGKPYAIELLPLVVAVVYNKFPLTCKAQALYIIWKWGALKHVFVSKGCDWKKILQDQSPRPRHIPKPYWRKGRVKSVLNVRK